MLGQLLQYLRARKHQASERQLVEQFASELSGFNAIAALVYPVTEYVNDSDVPDRLAALKALLGNRLSVVATPDAAWRPGTYAGMQVSSLEDVAKSDIDCVTIVSSQFAEVLFSLFNTSEARHLPLIAPALPGVPHRLFLRKEIFEVLRSVPEPAVLEIGSIEHPLGGHRTTQALAETMWGRGSLTTVDINPFTLRLAELYCRSTPTRIAYVAGDCRDVLRKSEKTALDFVLLHFMSDNSDVSNPLIEAFDLIEPRLSAKAPVVFQSVRTGDALPGSLQMHLRSKGYVPVITPIPATSNPVRFFVVARKA